MDERVTIRLDLWALARAGATVGVILYILCLLFFWLVYGAQGDWMIRPFMPGLSTSTGGLVVGLLWSVAYGGGIPWLLGLFYNRWATPRPQ